MKANEVILEQLATARYVMSRYLEDLTDAELHLSPVAGAHTAAWQLGHLIVSEKRMVEGVRAGAGVELPAGFEEAHAKDAAPQDATPAFSKAHYTELMKSQRERTVALLESLSESDLSKPAPEFMRAYAPHVGSVFASIAGHELMHSGQVAVLRRSLGKPVVI